MSRSLNAAESNEILKVARELPPLLPSGVIELVAFKLTS